MLKTMSQSFYNIPLKRNNNLVIVLLNVNAKKIVQLKHSIENLNIFYSCKLYKTLQHYKLLYPQTSNISKKYSIIYHNMAIITSYDPATFDVQTHNSFIHLWYPQVDLEDMWRIRGTRRENLPQMGHRVYVRVPHTHEYFYNYDYIYSRLGAV